MNADLRALPFRASSFDLIINLWTSFGFFDDDDNQQVLRQWAQVLRSGGRILLHSDLNPRRVKQGIFDEPSVRDLTNSRTLTVIERYCQEDGRVYGTWRVGDMTHSYKLLLYDEERLAEMATMAGFDVVGFWGSLDEPFLELTDRSQEFITVLRKRD